jgi:hypothetical protein
MAIQFLEKRFACLIILPAMLIAVSLQGASWKIEEGENASGPGQKVDFIGNGKLVGRFIHGQGQFKPYLHVFGEGEEPLTNGGLDREGKPAGLYPHHRGIFIGWKIDSELGTDDLWHMTKGCRMEVEKITHTSTSVEPGPGAATLQAEISWRAAKKDQSGNDLLLTETRTISFSRPKPKQTVIDATFVLNPARDISLVGDLQHSGIHFRASNEIAQRTNETSYVFEPENVVKGHNLTWVNLLFPIGQRWYTAMEMNAPSNPVDELSMRDYGRFGYFFKKELKKSEPLKLKYRFAIEQVEEPVAKPKLSTEQITALQAQCESLFKQFLQSVK